MISSEGGIPSPIDPASVHDASRCSSPIIAVVNVVVNVVVVLATAEPCRRRQCARRPGAFQAGRHSHRRENAWLRRASKARECQTRRRRRGAARAHASPMRFAGPGRRRSSLRTSGMARRRLAKPGERQRRRRRRGRTNGSRASRGQARVGHRGAGEGPSGAAEGALGDENIERTAADETHNDDDITDGYYYSNDSDDDLHIDTLSSEAVRDTHRKRQIYEHKSEDDSKVAAQGNSLTAMAPRLRKQASAVA